MRLAVFRTILRDCHQDLFRVCTYHSELHQISRIEENICILLIRINPFDFRATYIRPVHNGLPCRESSFVEVTDYTSEKPVVTCRDAVMVIK